MCESLLIVDEAQREVIWCVALSHPDQRITTPWGVLWRGQDLPEGLEIWVEAHASFFLIAQGERAIRAEAITPGRHRLLITWLDSTDQDA